MRNARRLVTATGGIAAIVLIAAQVTTAAPAVKVGTSYYTNGGREVPNLGVVVASMTIPAGKYHVTATVLLDNNVPGAGAGAYVNEVYCSLFGAGITIQATNQSLGAGEFENLTLDGVTDGSRLQDVYIELACSALGAVSPLPHISANITADTIASMVDLRPTN